MIAILRKGFISCLISSNNRNLQFSENIHFIVGFMKRDRKAATTRGCPLGYADTLNFCSVTYYALFLITYFNNLLLT